MFFIGAGGFLMAANIFFSTVYFFSTHNIYLAVESINVQINVSNSFLAKGKRLRWSVDELCIHKIMFQQCF